MEPSPDIIRVYSNPVTKHNAEHVFKFYYYDFLIFYFVLAHTVDEQGYVSLRYTAE